MRCWSELLEFAQAEQAETGWSFVVYGLGNMGEWQIKAGDTAAGLDSMRRAVETAYTGYGPGHFHVLMTEYAYAHALHNAGEREQAYELMNRLAEEAGQLLGEAHQLTTDAREALRSWSASG
ncbi:hypothetical protein ACFQY4_17760 [Catellatospora bangladeshensis]|uniref:hypothetical protein n=1 Tax=Catellatospora bangladeshensis TaxID=310355 RepID=UPI00361911C9